MVGKNTYRLHNNNISSKEQFMSLKKFIEQENLPSTSCKRKQM